MPSPDLATCRADPPVDPRGVRFNAGVTTVVLALVLLSGSPWLVAAQALLVALGAFAGLRFAPYSVLHRVYALLTRLRNRPKLNSPKQNSNEQNEQGATA